VVQLGPSFRFWLQVAFQSEMAPSFQCRAPCGNATCRCSLNKVRQEHRLA
jgi:hypothetical protein